MSTLREKSACATLGVVAVCSQLRPLLRPHRFRLRLLQPIHGSIQEAGRQPATAGLQYESEAYDGEDRSEIPGSLARIHCRDDARRSRMLPLEVGQSRALPDVDAQSPLREVGTAKSDVIRFSRKRDTGSDCKRQDVVTDNGWGATDSVPDDERGPCDQLSSRPWRDLVLSQRALRLNGFSPLSRQ